MTKNDLANKAVSLMKERDLLEKKVKQLNLANKKLEQQLRIGGVVRSAVDIELRIKEIEEERREMLQNYIDSTDDKERDIISLIAMEKALTIKELKWVLNE